MRAFRRTLSRVMRSSETGEIWKGQRNTSSREKKTVILLRDKT